MNIMISTDTKVNRHHVETEKPTSNIYITLTQFCKSQE